MNAGTTRVYITQRANLFSTADPRGMSDALVQQIQTWMSKQECIRRALVQAGVHAEDVPDPVSYLYEMTTPYSVLSVPSLCLCVCVCLSLSLSRLSSVQRPILKAIPLRHRISAVRSISEVDHGGRSRLASRIRQERQTIQPFTASTQPSFSSPEVWRSRHSGGGRRTSPRRPAPFFGTENGVIETKIEGS